MKKNTILSTILLLITVIMTSCAPSTTPLTVIEKPSDIEILSSYENAITKIVDQSMPAIVSLNVTKKNPKDKKDGSSTASGFIFRSDGYIITNEHVVNGAKSIRVSLFNNRTYDARIIGSDPNTDIAVIKIEDEKEFPVLMIADSEKVRIGQFAIAIGDPLRFRYTVTAGIIGGKDRCYHPESKLFQYHRNYIQTDAWINPGSSGGPLLNIQGEVIGINTLNPGEGSTLAINSGLAKKIAHKLIKHGRIIRGYIDAEMRSVSKGIKVTKVTPNTLAAQSGLQPDDIITECDNEKVSNLDKFRLAVMEYQIGKKCTLKVLRQAQEISLNITIEEMPLTLVGGSVNTKSASWKKLGLSVRTLENVNSQRYTYLTEEDRGIIVEKVKLNSPGSVAKIPKCALIVAINGQEIADAQSFETFLQSQNDISDLTLEIKSFNGEKTVKVKLSQELTKKDISES